MAFRAVRFSEEEDQTYFSISGDQSGFLSSLQSAQVGHNGSNLIPFKNRAKGGNARSGYAVLNDALEIGVRYLLKFCVPRNVGGVLAAFAVESVAPGAIGVEELLARLAGLCIEQGERSGEKKKPDRSDAESLALN
jgi:hypothetical protein